MKEQRERKRVLIQESVLINGIIRANALDISEEGMYISTQAEFVTGAVIELAFKLKDKDLKIKGLVQHVQPGIGMGVRFLNLSPETYSVIRGFVNEVAEVAMKPRERVILLVDDSAQSRAIYRNKLTLDGFTVIEASDGIEALKSLQENKPDLVILDLWMEGIDGFKLLQLMDLNPELKNIPVIILSARSVPVDIQKAIALGARDFLPKMTTTPVKLSERVKEYFKK
ncbi:MAG: response regulator [Thermodesulfovibrionales bacterium]